VGSGAAENSLSVDARRGISRDGALVQFRQVKALRFPAIVQPRNDMVA
jgi:hypothetical protein